MKKFVLVLSGFCVACLVTPITVLAADEAIQTMAKITMSLNHFPSDEDKAILKAIIDGDESTEEEADIALALTNFEHKVAEKDTERLLDIIGDDTSDADARQLAGIVLRVNHTPGDDDKMMLTKLSE